MNNVSFFFFFFLFESILSYFYVRNINELSDPNVYYSLSVVYKKNVKINV